MFTMLRTKFAQIEIATMSRKMVILPKLTTCPTVLSVIGIADTCGVKMSKSLSLAVTGWKTLGVGDIRSSCGVYERSYHGRPSSSTKNMYLLRKYDRTCDFSHVPLSLSDRTHKTFYDVVDGHANRPEIEIAKYLHTTGSSLATSETHVSQARDQEVAHHQEFPTNAYKSSSAVGSKVSDKKKHYIWNRSSVSHMKYQISPIGFPKIYDTCNCALAISPGSSMNNANVSRLYSTKSNKSDATNIKVQAPLPEEVRETLEETVKVFKKDIVFTVPNVLTASRLVLSPVLGFLVLHESYSLACGVFIFAGITDVLDGWIARTYPNQTSAIGSFLDPLADKFLVSILFVTLTMVDLIPVPLTALVLMRDVALIGAAFYIRYLSLPPPRDLKTYFSITKATAQLKPRFISKINTAVQLSLVTFTLAAPVFGYVDHPALQALWCVTAATTYFSGVDYMFATDTFKFIQQQTVKSKNTRNPPN